MQHFPVISIMVLFLGAFLLECLGRFGSILRNVILLGTTAASFIMTLSLIPSVMLRGEILTYWLGNWEPVSGYAIGICLEVDALSLLFALIVTLSVFLAAMCKI